MLKYDQLNHLGKIAYHSGSHTMTDSGYAPHPPHGMSGAFQTTADPKPTPLPRDTWERLTKKATAVPDINQNPETAAINGNKSSTAPSTGQPSPEKPIWQTGPFTEGKAEGPSAWKRWTGAAASATKGNIIPMWSQIFGAEGAGEAFTEETFGSLKDDFMENFWLREERSGLPDQPGIEEVIAQAAEEARGLGHSNVASRTRSHIQEKVRNWVQTPGVKNLPFGIKPQGAQEPRGGFTPDQRKSLVYAMISEELEKVGVDADQFIAVNLPEIADMAEVVAEQKATMEKSRVATTAAPDIEWDKTSKDTLTELTNMTKNLGIGRIFDPTAPDAIDFDKAFSDPNYRRSLTQAANKVIELPEGWSYSPAQVDATTGRVVRGSMLNPPIVADAEDPRHGLLREDAVALTSEQQANFIQALDLQHRASDVLSRAELTSQTLMDDRLKYEHETAEREAKERFETGELEQKQSFTTTEREAVQDFTTAERLDTQKHTTQERRETQGFVTRNTIMQWSQSEITRNETQLFQASETLAQRKHQVSQQDDQQTWMTGEREAKEEFVIEYERSWQEADRDAGFGQDVKMQDDQQAFLMDIDRQQHGNMMAQIGAKADNARRLEYTKLDTDKQRIGAQSQADLKAIDARGKIETGIQVLKDKGAMERLATQITSNELMQGRQITSDEALATAERLLRKELQTEQLNHEISQLDTQGQQDINSIQETGTEQRLTQEQALLAQQAIQDTVGTQAIAQIMATGTTELEAIAARGVEERETLGLQAELGMETFREQRLFEEGLRQLPSLDAGASIEQVRQLSSTYTSGLNNAISTATTSGDYSAVNTALAAELPPMPVGVQWDRDAGGFRMRPGYEGRQMDAGTREWIAATTPAFKTRDRVEQAVQAANIIQLELTAKREDERIASERFREHMLTGDIDSAEEAATRQKMAETAALASQTKMEHVQMLFSLLQNPVLLGMAKRHGLLGQLEAVLGFTIDNVPSGPSNGAGTVPNANEWQTMDSEEQTFSLAAFVEQGGSPDEFIRRIAGAAPAQMQQLQYGVL